MSDKEGVGVTAISHDSETGNRTQVNISQLVSLINVSLYCEQFVKYQYND